MNEDYEKLPDGMIVGVDLAEKTPRVIARRLGDPIARLKLKHPGLSDTTAARMVYDAAPHPKSENVPDWIVALLPAKDQERIAAARNRRRR